MSRAVTANEADKENINEERRVGLLHVRHIENDRWCETKEDGPLCSSKQGVVGGPCTAPTSGTHCAQP